MMTQENISPELRPVVERIQKLLIHKAVRYFKTLPKAQRDAVRALLLSSW